jgi:hypothetical protein
MREVGRLESGMVEDEEEFENGLGSEVELDDDEFKLLMPPALIVLALALALPRGSIAAVVSVDILFNIAVVYECEKIIFELLKIKSLDETPRCRR